MSKLMVEKVTLKSLIEEKEVELKELENQLIDAYEEIQYLEERLDDVRAALMEE